MRSVELNLSAAANPPDKRTAAGTDPRQILFYPVYCGRRKSCREWSESRATAGDGGVPAWIIHSRRRHRHRENTDVTGCRSNKCALGPRSPPPSLPPRSFIICDCDRLIQKRSRWLRNAQCPVPVLLTNAVFFLFDAAHTEQALSWNGTELELVCLAGSMYSIQSNRVRPDSSR